MKMTSSQRLFCAHVIAFVGIFAHSFHIGPLTHYSTPTPLFVIHRSNPPLLLPLSAASDTSETKDASSKSSNTASLTLEGRTTVESNVVPIESIENLNQFFQKSDFRNLLVTAGGKRSFEEIDLTPELIKKWETACDQVGSTYPIENDVVLKVKTGGIDFPGLHLTSVVNIGCKFLNEDEDETSSGGQKTNARYEFTTLGDEQTVTGLRPVVWIFNKLTGGDKGDDNTTTKSLTTFTFDMKEDKQSVVFTSNSFLSVVVSFPSFLLKILPTSKEKAEENGGKSIKNVLEKDVVAAMESYEKAYLNWLGGQKDNN